MLKASFSECQRSPDSFAFLCDELAKSIEQQRVSRCAEWQPGSTWPSSFEHGIQR